MWIGNIYLSKGSIQQLSGLLKKVLTNVPGDEIRNLISIGDFNCNRNLANKKRMKLLNLIAKNLSMSIVSSGGSTRGESELDYAIVGNNINLVLREEESLSDQKALKGIIATKRERFKQIILIPDKKTR